jgi:hypothetical protein
VTTAKRGRTRSRRPSGHCPSAWPIGTSIQNDQIVGKAVLQIYRTTNFQFHRIHENYVSEQTFNSLWRKVLLKSKIVSGAATTIHYELRSGRAVSQVVDGPLPSVRTELDPTNNCESHHNEGMRPREGYNGVHFEKWMIPCAFKPRGSRRAGSRRIQYRVEHCRPNSALHVATKRGSKLFNRWLLLRGSRLKKVNGSFCWRIAAIINFQDCTAARRPRFIVWIWDLLN